MSRAWLWLGLLVAVTGSAKELVLVDADLATQIQAKPGVELRRLHGLDDLPGALAGDRWSRVSLISHGQPGALQLGGERLDQGFFAQHPGFLNAWRQQLTTNAQLELWGCAVAKGQGHQLVDSLSTSIGRPVLASTDATGPSRLGGNLSLEYGHGRVPDSAPLTHLQQLLLAALTSANSENFDSCVNCDDNTAYSVATVFGSFKVFASPNNSLAVDPAPTSPAPADAFSTTQSLMVMANNIGDVTMIRVASSGGSGDGGNGGHFRLKSIKLKGNYTGGYSTDVLIHAFRNGTEIGTGTPLDLSTPKVFDLSSNANFYDIDAFTITGPDLVIRMDDIMVDAPLIPKDSDGGLTAGDGTEPTSIATTAGATAALDFKLTDGGTSDGLAMEVSQVKVHLSGTSTDTERSNVAWTLTGPDITGSVTGSYSSGVVTFTGLSISVANGGNETYTLNANLGHDGLTEGHTFILSLAGATDLTLGSAGTKMSSTDPVTNGPNGFTTSVTATKLAFTIEPAFAISGQALGTQPMVAAQDSFGNTDTDFTGNVSLTEASAGTLGGITIRSANTGVATFTDLAYTASADQEAFILTATATGLTDATANSVTSEVVATKLLFSTQPAPTSLSSGSTTNFTTVPVLKAVDANNTVDTGYNTNMVLSVSNTSGGAVAGTVNSLTATGDSDGSATTVTLTPTSGSATFSALALNYTNAGVSDNLALRATSGPLSAALSTTLTSLALPTVTDAHISISGASGTGGTFKIGDTVTATWNNTAGGDNNSGVTGVTVDFSQFGGGTAVAASNSGGIWTATYTITSGSMDATNRNVSVSATNVNGTRTTADGSNATVDNQTPTVSDARISLSGASGTGGAFKAGDTVTATWNNTASGDNNGDISAVTVDFSAFGGGAAVAASNSGGTWTATYTLVAGTIADTNRNVSVTATDNAGNSKTTADTSNASVDNTVPAEQNITSPAGGTYITGQNLDFTVNFTDAVTVTGTPRLELTLGSDTVYANYVSGSGSSALIFRHTVVAGESDTDGIAIGNLSLNGGTIRDVAGNNAQTFNIPIPLNGVRVDAIAPIVNSVAVPTSGTYISGQPLDFTVHFDDAVTVNTSGGAPQLALTLGSSTVYASYVSGSGSAALNFNYTVQAGDSDSNGISVGILSANGGTLKDTVGNDAVLTLNSVASTASVLVDGIAPTLSSSSPADGSTSVAVDANVQLVLSEAIAAGSGNLALYDAADDSLVEANAVVSSRVSLSGNTVTLDPQATLIPTHSYYLQIGAQALLDAAGNAYAGISDKTTLNFTIANAAPVAQADSASTQEDAAVQVDVTANDSDADSALNKASVTVVTAAQHGATSVDTASGVITYTPVANYNGNDSFTYRVQDIYGANSNAVTVSLTVQAVNDAPVTVADIGSTLEDSSLTIDVLANDSDIDSGDSLSSATLALVTSPAHGSAQISNGEVTYTPAANFNGSDAFSYTVADQHGAVSNVATVTINVGSSNDAPVAANDTASTDEDLAATVDVLANDSDVDGTLVPTTVALLQQPAHGVVSINGVTGALVYTPTANYFGQDTFSYAVKDNEGAISNAASVTVTVNGINDAPVAANNSVTLLEDASLSVNVLGNDSDVDGTLVAASVQLVSQPAHGTATVSTADGSVLYTPTSNAVGDDSFTYRVQDDQGAWSNVATVALTIQSVNDAPLANADQGALDEDSTLTLHLLDNDSDIDGSLQDVHITAQPASGSLDVGSSGEVIYTPTLNFHGSDVFSYQAVDNEGALSPSVVVTLTIRPVNDAPTINGSGTATLLEGASYQFAPVINDVDGDALTVTASGLPQWLSINSRTGELSGTPIVGQAGQYDNIVLTVSDGVAQSALPAFALTVQADLDGDGLANSVDTDDDNDGMSDGYEDEHGFNPLDPADGTTDADQDGVSNQQESADGTNPHDASDYLDTTAPVVSAVADVTLDATGLFTPITVRKLLGLADTATDEEVVTELRALSSDSIDGAACCSVTIDDMADNQLLLAPGRHEVVYRASDRKGNVGTVTQLVRVRPLVSMSKDQLAVPGQSLSFSIILNGPAPDYPFTVPYALDDSSTLPTDQHSLQAGSVTFTSGQTVLTVPVVLGADAAANGNQTLVVRLDDETSDEQDLAGGYDPAAPDSHDINAGSKRAHAITVTKGNVAPQVDLSLQQNGQQTMLVTPSGGSVTVSATVQDPNTADTHTFDWSGTAAEVVDTDENLTDAALVFDPAGLAEGVYPVQVTVTDSQGASTPHTLYFRVVTSLPELSAESDMDDDGVSDQTEGVADSDGDGIVDYLDNLSTPNLLPEAMATTAAFVMECDPGVLCRLGQYALQNGASGSRLLASELASLPSMRQDSRFTPVGGIFDFEIAELPTAGQSVSVVIPLNEAIPVNAVYRKFQNGRWRTFVEDDDNQLHSAPGSLGFCPPPGDAQWTSGLTAGNYCVQLTLEDGGPNDADGVVNASIADPGAVSVSTADDTDDDGSGSVGGAGLLALWALQRYRRRDRGAVRH